MNKLKWVYVVDCFFNGRWYDNPQVFTTYEKAIQYKTKVVLRMKKKMGQYDTISMQIKRMKLR